MKAFPPRLTLHPGSWSHELWQMACIAVVMSILGALAVLTLGGRP